MAPLASSQSRVVAPRTNFPGPAGYLCLGSLLELQEGHVRTLSQWAEQYGEIFQVNLGHRFAIVLNSHEAVAKTIIHNGAAFQSRPEFHLFHHAFSKALDQDALSTIGTMKYNQDVNRYRKLLSQQTNVQKLRSYDPFFMQRCVNFMRGLASASSRDTPCDLGYYLWTATVGISSDQLFGLNLDEETIRIITDTTIRIFRQRSLGAPFQDYVPFLSYARQIASAILSPTLPILRALGISTWLESFNSAEAEAEDLRQIEVDYCKRSLHQLQQRLHDGDTTPSIMGDILRRHPLTEQEQLMFATTLAGTGMGAGTTLIWLTGKLAASPEMQERAIAAIRAVYGDDAPDPLDTDRVEYIKALVLEAGRFWTSIRSGFLRQTLEDVVVDGVLIPKDTLVIYNSFQINRDPVRYDLPQEFVPERWMNGHDGRTDQLGHSGSRIGVPHITHGAGRRICMGISSVHKTLYGILILLLHSFRLERAPLSDLSKAEVFPSLRATQEASLEMDPIQDQLSACDAQALPGCVGIRLMMRDSNRLTKWLADAEGCDERE